MDSLVNIYKHSHLRKLAQKLLFSSHLNCPAPRGSHSPDLRHLSIMTHELSSVSERRVKGPLCSPDFPQSAREPVWGDCGLCSQLSRVPGMSLLGTVTVLTDAGVVFVRRLLGAGCSERLSSTWGVGESLGHVSRRRRAVSSAGMGKAQGFRRAKRQNLVLQVSLGLGFLSTPSLYISSAANILLF